MATGTEMLISTLIKALKLEPEVDKIRAAIDAGMVEKFQNAITAVQTFDERLARIEIALGIEPGAGPDTGRDAARLDSFLASQSDDRSDNAGH